MTNYFLPCVWLITANVILFWLIIKYYPKPLILVFQIDNLPKLHFFRCYWTSVEILCIEDPETLLYNSHHSPYILNSSEMMLDAIVQKKLLQNLPYFCNMKIKMVANIFLSFLNMDARAQKSELLMPIISSSINFLFLKCELQCSSGKAI